MDVLEALGGWRNINQEKLEQIKVDNPPLYDAITKAINLLAKKYGGEDIIIQKPIEVVEEVITPTQKGQLTDYQILKKIEILSEAKLDDWITIEELLDSFIEEMGFDKNEIVAIEDFKQELFAKLSDLKSRDLVARIGDLNGGFLLNINVYSQNYINDYELQNKQVEENREVRGLSDLEKSILLSQRRGTESSFKEIFDSVEKVALQKFQLNISYLGLREKLEAIEKLVEDGYLNKIVSSAYGNAYILTEKGEDAVNKIISDGGQPPQETPSDEDLKLEILTRMTDYYDGGDYNLLNQDDIITNAVKHQFDIPSNKYFGLVVKLLGDGFVEKDPSGLTDSIRLTNKGYDKAMDWFEENLPEEEEEANQYDFPSERQDQVLIAVYDAERNFDRFVTLDEIYNELLPNLPANYPKSGIGGEPTLEKDLQILEGNNLVIRRLMTLPKIGAEYAIDTRQLALINVLKKKRANPQQQKSSSLRPSPTESATLFSTGRIKVGNDGNLWKVMETKNGVKRWTKVGDTPSELPDQTPVETPISEIEEDEVDLDILEQQLNDDSLEFDISDEDLENLEF